MKKLILTTTLTALSCYSSENYQAGPSSIPTYPTNSRSFFSSSIEEENMRLILEANESRYQTSQALLQAPSIEEYKQIVQQRVKLPEQERLRLAKQDKQRFERIRNKEMYRISQEAERVLETQEDYSVLIEKNANLLESRKKFLDSQRRLKRPLIIRTLSKLCCSCNNNKK